MATITHSNSEKLNKNEITKDIEKLILKYLNDSKSFWVDLFPLIEKSKYSYFEFFNILTELIKEKKIKIKDDNNISFLKLTTNGKLINKSELFFRIDKKEIKTKWYNQSWVGYLIAFITLLFAFYQWYANKNIENNIYSLKNRADSLSIEVLSLNKKLDSLNVQHVLFEKKLYNLKTQIETKK